MRISSSCEIDSDVDMYRHTSGSGCCVNGLRDSKQHHRASNGNGVEEVTDHSRERIGCFAEGEVLGTRQLNNGKGCMEIKDTQMLSS